MGIFSELLHIIGNNAVIFVGSAGILYFMKRLEAYSRLAFVYFILLDCILMFILHYRMPVTELTGAKQKVLSQTGSSYNVTYAGRMVPAGQFFVKRAMDICGALIGCIFLALITVIRYVYTKIKIE